MRFNSLIPELSVSDIDISKEFYIDILGFKIEYERKEDKFAFLSYEDAQIMIEEINGNWNTGELTKPFGRGINFQITVSDAEAICKRAKDNGIKLFRDMTLNRYMTADGDVIEREILLQDPDGYLLRFSEQLPAILV